MQLSGIIVLRIVASLMILLGGTGVFTALTAFSGVEQQLQQQLSQVDGAVKTVSATVTQASTSVGESGKMLGSSIDSVVGFLNSTSRSVTDVGSALKNATSAVTNVEYQLPEVINSAAGTLDTASKSMFKVSGDVTQVGNQLTSIRTGAQVADLNRQIQAMRDSMKGQTLSVDGNLLYQNSAVIAQMLGLPQQVVVEEAQSLALRGKTFTFNSTDVLVSGDDLLEISRIAESRFGVDPTMIEQAAKAANDQKVSYRLFQPDQLLTVEGTLQDNADRVDEILFQARQALVSSSDEMKTLSASLSANSKTLRDTQSSLNGVTGQVKQILDTTNTQMGNVAKSLTDVSTQANNIKSTASKEITALASGLKSTADAIGQFSSTPVLGMTTGIFSGIRTYMLLTYSLFLVTGIGLFLVTLRPRSAADAAKAAA